MAEKTTVKLVNKNAGKDEEAEKEMSVKDAQALLRYQASKGYSDWELDDPGFKYENGTIEPTDTGASKKSGTQGSNK